MSTVMVQIPVDEETAAARLQAVGELVKLVVRPGDGNDPLAVLLEAMRHDAAAVGLSDRDIDDELAAWKAERARQRA